MINKLAKEIHENNVDKGFYEDEKNIGEMLCLIHSEISEALEADRNNKYCDAPNLVLQWLADKNFGMPFHDDEQFQRVFKLDVKDTFEDELADIVIRVLDLAAFRGIDIESHIKAKIRYNALRPHKHGKKY